MTAQSILRTLFIPTPFSVLTFDFKHPDTLAPGTIEDEFGATLLYLLQDARRIEEEALNRNVMSFLNANGYFAPTP
jgi:hypothetical protein